MEHIERMKEEHKQLMEKVTKLKDFRTSEQFKKLDTLQQQMIIIQYTTMISYIETLATRIGYDEYVYADELKEK